MTHNSAAAELSVIKQGFELTLTLKKKSGCHTPHQGALIIFS